ncbi:MAG TPA: ribosome maturation factor RimP [Rickettsiales bacterium]|nr:ribosome maturation factor RimP [Rickettsiales bacterium]
MEFSIQDKIVAIIEPSLNGMGYNLVQVKLIEGGRRTLQIMAERIDGRNMTVDDCADISYNVSALLDVEDPISDAYHLEISSPGIDRPLVKLQDFERFSGFEAKLETKMLIDGRKRFKGRIKGIQEQNVLMETEEGTASVIPFNMVRSAKLLLTDELLKKAAAGQVNN